MSKILFVQPFGFGGHGGAPYLFRGLCEKRDDVISVCSSPAPPPLSPFPEYHYPRRKTFGRLESTRFVYQLEALAEVKSSQMIRWLVQLAQQKDVKIIHSVAHSTDFWPAFQASRILNIPFALTCHDDLAYVQKHNPLRGLAFRRLREVWRRADLRFVISQQLGEAYSHRFGSLPFHIVTHGLQEVPEEPRSRQGDRLNVYFAGSVYVSYEANFRSLFRALELLKKENNRLKPSVIFRSGPLDISLPSFAHLRDGEDDRGYVSDLEEIDLLYLPIPFESRHIAFSRYSLPTKLVTYLGIGLPIVCHGPKDSAAAQALQKRSAALCAGSLDEALLAKTLIKAIEERESLARSALELARKQFLLKDTRRKFWGALCPDRNLALLRHEDP